MYMCVCMYVLLPTMISITIAIITITTTTIINAYITIIISKLRVIRK